MPDYNKSINRVFTKKVIHDLAFTGHNSIYDFVVKRFLVDTENKTNGELISEIYSHLGKSYRNEYYYTNTLLNKLLVNIHSVTTTTALSQVRIADHIADFVMINGEGKVYEIKSDLDNLERLTDQLYDYYKAFSYVSVLASEHELNHIEQLLSKLGDMGNAVGIYVLSEKDTIFSKKIGRQPTRYNENLDHKCLFNLLRKAEYTGLIQRYFGILPDVAPAFYYKECLKLFSTIDILTAQKLTYVELKKRNRITKEVFNSIPFELKSVVYFSDYSRITERINHFLCEPYRGGN